MKRSSINLPTFSYQDYKEMENYIKGARFAHINAKDLLFEANVLFGAKKYSRSKVLATFALEELGKAILILEVFFQLEFKNNKIIKIFKDKMKKGFRDKDAHKLKIRKVYNFAYRNHPELLETVSSQAELDHKSKLDSLYVEIKNGQFHPPKKPNRKEIKNFLTFISMVLNFSFVAFTGLEKIFYTAYKKGIR